MIDGNLKVTDPIALAAIILPISTLKNGKIVIKDKAGKVVAHVVEANGVRRIIDPKTGKVLKEFKAVSLPSAKKVKIDMQEVLSGHKVGGSRVSPKKDLFPENWSDAQIEKAIMDAYKRAKRIKTQGDRVKLVGCSNGITIEMWVNIKTEIIETAYPKKP